ncbi:Chromosome partition protein Smc [Carpediemonas membranifera]|uniref:Chromosome partition protein Smc n=1 Tax=Carpediemonas membranifera TaxID=201153 RepID=A0A8J6B6T3_9EUKA|nr:Chromosome partition protein Smc [Carpediemonas membranifera]|eukprot:KAG9396858.1 Chromosome partition protein Smc [Carpediemonas membranifera]
MDSEEDIMKTLPSGKLLKAIEHRGKRAEESLKQIRVASAQFRREKSEKPSDMVASIAVTSRDNYKSFINTMHVEDIKIQAQKRIDESQQAFDITLNKNNEELCILERQVEQYRDDLDEAKSVEMSLRDTIELLNKKMRRMQVREVESQRRLQTFAKFEPIFDALSERFHFSSPEEVITRLETLEAQQVTLYTEIVEAQEAKASLERQSHRAKQDAEGKLQTQVTDLLQSLSKSEARINELLQIQAQQQSTVDQAEELKRKHLALVFGIVDLWDVWERESNLIDPNNKIDRPDMSDPEQILAALKTVSAAHDPNRAGVMLRELSSQANSLWMKYLSHEDDTRMRPKQIFQRLHGMLDSRQKKIELLTRQNSTLQQSSSNNGERLAAMERENRQLKTYIEQHRQMFKEPSVAGSRPSSSAAASRVRPGTVSAFGRRQRDEFRPHTVIGSAAQDLTGLGKTTPAKKKTVAIEEDGAEGELAVRGTARPEAEPQARGPRKPPRPTSAGIGIRRDGTSVGQRPRSVLGLI